MAKQFLLNPDGSIPEGANIMSLQEAGIPLVMPTEAPAEHGMVAVEQEPQQDADGIWRQTWKLEPVPDPEPVQVSTPVDPLLSLTIEQKQALIELLSKQV